MIRLDAHAEELFNARGESFLSERSTDEWNCKSPLKIVEIDLAA
jgi:hypothetical protein